MDYPIRLPGKPPVVLKGWGNLPIELLAAVAGVKPVVHAWLQEADEGYLKDLRAGLGLESLVYTKQSGRLGVMIGARKEHLRETAEVWDKPESNPGPNLGYPACCSKTYCGWIDDSRTDREDYIYRIHANTKDRRRLPFLLNDVFYLYSRPFKPGLPEAREQIERKNANLPMNVLNVIPWHPCSYRCAASLAKARKIWKLMNELLPDLAAVVKSTLAKPVLFWDWDRFAVLDGKVLADGTCVYGSVLPPFSLLTPRAAALLAAGDRARAREGVLEVRRGSQKLGEIAGPCLLLDFVA